MKFFCKIFGHWYKVTPIETGFARVRCRICGDRDVRIAFISHDRARINEKPKDITNEIIEIITNASKSL